MAQAGRLEMPIRGGESGPHPQARLADLLGQRYISKDKEVLFVNRPEYAHHIAVLNVDGRQVDTEMFLQRLDKGLVRRLPESGLAEERPARGDSVTLAPAGA
jgi:hypothetical protein